MKIARGRTWAASLAVAFALGAVSAAAAPADALPACLARCDRARLSETNRATCKLDCEQDAATDPELIRAQIEGSRTSKTTPSASPRGSTPVPTASGREACKAQCAADRTLSEDDRATCRLECDLVEGSGGAPAGGQARAQAPGAQVAAPVQPAVAQPSSGLGPVPSSFLTMCLQTCRLSQGTAGPSDQATCRLTCENTASVVDVALDAAPMGWFAAAPAPTVLMAARPAVTATPTGTGHAPGISPHAGSTSASPVGASQPPSCALARETCEGACQKVRTSCERGCKGQKNETDRETCKLDCADNSSLCRGDCVGEHASCVNRGGR